MRCSLGLANLFGLALQRNDGRSDVDGALTLMESLDFGGDEGLGVAGLAAALFHVGRGHLLQVVDVVDEDAVELVHRRVDVAGTAISMKNMGRLRRRWRKAWPCSGRKMGCGAPVELMTMSALLAAS